jgi:hypothetical protein
MANNLGGFDLTDFAATAISTLHDKLGIAARVYRGYDQRPGQKGNTITIGKPSVGTVSDFGAGAVDLADSQVDITLDYHREIHFALTEKQLHGTMDDIVRVHAAPQLKTLAGDIDLKLAALYKNIPWAVDVNTTAGSEAANIIDPRQVLAGNGVDVDGGEIFLAVNATEEGRFLKSGLVQADYVGEQAARMMALEGSFLMFGGVNVFRSGKIQTHTSGTAINGGDVAGALNGAASAGATSIAVDGFTGSETFAIGDAFVIAGNAQRYVVTATATLSTGAATLSIYPALVADYADNAVVTFEAGSGSNAESFNANLMFHREAFALATAPVQSEQGSQQARNQGYMVENIVDDETGIAMRFMMWYERASGLNVAADVLYGVKTLDPNKAVRLRSAA